MSRLTPRQLDVLTALAWGRTYAEAAIDLGISKQTIKRTVNDTYARLGATCLAEALLSVGWLSVPARPSLPSPAAPSFSERSVDPSGMDWEPAMAGPGRS